MIKIELVKEKLKKVTPEDLESVDDFIKKLISTKKNNGKRKMKLHLGEALKELSKEYTSVELQHKAVEWRIQDALNYKEKIVECYRFKNMDGIFIKSGKGYRV